MKQPSYRDRDFAAGQAILTLRTAIGLTQAGLADYLGVSRRAIGDWEAGNKYPKVENLKSFIGLAVEHEAFGSGREAEEIRSLWRITRQKVLLDETWLAGLLSAATPVVAGNSPPAAPGKIVQEANLPQVDWGEAPNIRNFSGRQPELAQLESWITDSQDCRLVALLGMGGIGKTSLSVKLGQQLTPHFQYVWWRSLRSAPPFNELLGNALRFLSGQTLTTPPHSPNEGISQLIDLLRQHRCLLILDNLETLLQEETDAGRYREGYADYALLLRRIAESDHQSCLVLTSREKPRELGALEGSNSPVRTMRLNGLDESEFQTILADRGLVGQASDWVGLTERYSGNPLALKLVSETVRETFGGDIKAFLATNTIAFGDVGYLLDSQFERLTELERDLMFWLAIEREGVNLVTLEDNLSGQLINRRTLLEAVESLRRRNLIERSESRSEFTQQPVVMEYVSERLVEGVRSEILNARLAADISGPPYRFLAKYALLKAQAKDYIRQSQNRVIIQPLLARLKSASPEAGQVENYLKLTLERVRKLPQEQQGYAGGNILNLMVSLGHNLQGWDFSGLKVWQAYLAGVELRDVNMAGSDLSRSSFTEAFNSILALAYSPDGQFLAGGSLAGDIKVWRFQDKIEGSNYSLLLECRGHTDIVSAVAYSPDGRFLASASYDHTLRLWDAQSGESLLVLAGHTDTVRSVAFSPDGRLLASGSLDNTARLWRVATGELVATLEGHSGWVWSVAFSPDGRILASGSFDETIRLWRIEVPVNEHPPQHLATLSGHVGWVFGVAFSPDGQTFVSGGADGTVRQWSVAGREQLQVLAGHTGAVQAVAVSADGSTVASGSDDRTIRLWQRQSGSDTLRLSLPAHTAPVVALAFSPNNQTLASSSSDRSVRLWSARRGESLANLQGYTNGIASIAVNRDGTYLASTGNNNRVLVWQLNTQDLQLLSQIIPSARLKGHTNQLVSVAFSPDGTRLASAGRDKVIKLWDLPDTNPNSGSQARLTLTGHTDIINTLSFNPAGNLLASGGVDGTVRLWSTINGELLNTLEGHDSPVWTVVFSPDGTTLASGGNDGFARLWDARSGEPITRLGSDKIPIASLAYQPGGQLLASAMFNGTIRLWQPADNKQLPVILRGHQGTVWSVAFSPEPAAPPTLLSGGNDGTVRLWNTESSLELARFHHGGFVRSVAFMPDGRRVISAGDGGLVKLWDIAGGELVATYRDFRPYEGVNITGVLGLTVAERAALLMLGAVEH